MKCIIFNNARTKEGRTLEDEINIFLAALNASDQKVWHVLQTQSTTAAKFTLITITIFYK